MKISFQKIMASQKIEPDALTFSDNPNTEFPQFIKMLQNFKILPAGYEICVTKIKGTTFCKPEHVEQALKEFAATGDINLKIQYEPNNPYPPAFAVMHGQNRIGYLPAQLAKTLAARRSKYLSTISTYIVENRADKIAASFTIVIAYRVEENPEDCDTN